MNLVANEIHFVTAYFYQKGGGTHDSLLDELWKLFMHSRWTSGRTIHAFFELWVHKAKMWEVVLSKILQLRWPILGYINFQFFPLWAAEAQTN